MTALVPLAATAGDLDAGSLVLVLAAASAGAILSRLHSTDRPAHGRARDRARDPDRPGGARPRGGRQPTSTSSPTSVSCSCSSSRASSSSSTACARRSLVRGTTGWAISLALGIAVGLVPARGRPRRRGLAARRGAQHDRARHARPDPRRRGPAPDAARLGGARAPASPASSGRSSSSRSSSPAPTARHRDGAPARLRRASCSPRRRPRSARARRASCACSSRRCTRRARPPCACPCSSSPPSSSRDRGRLRLRARRVRRRASSSAWRSTPREAAPVRMRLEGVGFGFLIPIYFVVTGMNFDLDSLLTPDRPRPGGALPRAARRRPRHAVAALAPRAGAAPDAQPRPLRRHRPAADRRDRRDRHRTRRDRRRRRHLADRRRDDLGARLSRCSRPRSRAGNHPSWVMLGRPRLPRLDAGDGECR